MDYFGTRARKVMVVKRRWKAASTLPIIPLVRRRCQWCDKVLDRFCFEKLGGSFCFSLQISCMRDAAGRWSILLQSSSSILDTEKIRVLVIAKPITSSWRSRLGMIWVWELSCFCSNLYSLTWTAMVSSVAILFSDMIFCSFWFTFRCQGFWTLLC